MEESPTASDVFLFYFQTIFGLFKYIDRYRDVSCCGSRDYVHMILQWKSP